MAKRGRPLGPPKKAAWELAIEGMARAAVHAGDWGDYILERAMLYARHHEFFDVNDVNIANPDCQPPSPKAWGSRTNLWVSQQWCEKTGTILTSKNLAGHCHKLCQLRSLIYDRTSNARGDG